MKRSQSLTILAVLLLALSVSGQSNPISDSLLFSDYRYYDEPVNPDQYLIRPGEELPITFIKTKLPSITLKIGPEGKLVDRNLGSFELAGKSLSKAREILLPSLKELFNCEQIDISIGDPYRVAIMVRGAVVSPGIYTGFSSQRVSEIIELAGGLEDKGSSRLITFSGGEKKLDVDLEMANYAGDNSANPCLYAGNTVFVPRKSKRQVHLISPTARSWELLDSDNAETLARLAGVDGLNESAQLLVLRDDWIDISKSTIRSGDVLKIVSEDADSDISIFGAVNKPGRYAYADPLSLDDLLGLAGGTGSSALIDRIVIFRRLPSDEWGHYMDARIPLSLNRSGGGESPLLQSSDSVFVPGALGFVRVEGMVRSPGFYPYSEGFEIGDYVQLAGGITDEADHEKIMLTNRVTSFSAELSMEAAVGDGDMIRVKRLEIER